MSKLYLDSGYLNMEYIFQAKTTFNFITGGRGIGKTFGAIRYLLQNRIPFIFMRRTQTQIDMVKNDDFSPFTPVCEDLGIQVKIKSLNKNISAVYEAEAREDGTLEEKGLPLGYMIALSTVSNIRGYNLERVKVLLYDEFIGEAQEAKIKNEGDAFKNCYETLNRNREIKGQEPMKVIACANSNNLANPLYVAFNLVTAAEKLLYSDAEMLYMPEKDVTLYHIKRSPISRRKRETALYKLSGDDDYTRMALDNEYSANEMINIRSVNLQHYNILCQVGEAVIYKHKSESLYYVTDHIKGTPKRIYGSGVDLKLFRKDYYYLWLAYLRRKVNFESYIFQVLFEKYFNMYI